MRMKSLALVYFLQNFQLIGMGKKYQYRTFATNCLALLRSELASRIILFDVGLEVKYPVQYPCSSEAYGKKSSFFVGHASFVLPCRAITLQKILCFILLEILSTIS